MVGGYVKQGGDLPHLLIGNGFSHSVFCYVLISGLHLTTRIWVSIIPLPCFTACLASSLLFSPIYGFEPEIYFPPLIHDAGGKFGAKQTPWVT